MPLPRADGGLLIARRCLLQPLLSSPSCTFVRMCHVMLLDCCSWCAARRQLHDSCPDCAQAQGIRSHPKAQLRAKRMLLQG